MKRTIRKHVATQTEIMCQDLREAAFALSGDVSGNQVLFPGLGHSHKDRSACLRFSPDAPEGFVVYSFAGDDPLSLRDHVRERLGLKRSCPAPAHYHRRTIAQPVEFADCAARTKRAREMTKRALEIWNEGCDPRGTPVEAYLRHRGLELPCGAADQVIRFHASCPFVVIGFSP